MRVLRTRRRIARLEYDRAHMRYVAAQRIQSWARGVQVRHILGTRKVQVARAVYSIQKAWRGFSLRRGLWQKVLNARATTIQATARAFLVRRRLRRVVLSAILIQVSYKNFRHLSKGERQRRLDGMKRRNVAARQIQAGVRGVWTKLQEREQTATIRKAKAQAKSASVNGVAHGALAHLGSDALDAVYGSSPLANVQRARDGLLDSP
mmetsp:Transcript_27941/g.61602  ORF Transcript_27941/g.61602 Transcript_27941/m.61602 type:complete len:207 (+) Transcript_27941:3-623(+)